MLALANMLNLLVNKFTRRRRRRLAFSKIFFCALFRGFFWHFVPLSHSLSDAARDPESEERRYASINAACDPIGPFAGPKRYGPSNGSSTTALAVAIAATASPAE